MAEERPLMSRNKKLVLDLMPYANDVELKTALRAIFKVLDLSRFQTNFYSVKP